MMAMVELNSGRSLKMRRPVGKTLKGTLNAMGVTQFEYLSHLGTELTAEARQVLDNYHDKWDFENSANPNYEESVMRETDCDVWRTLYKRIYTLMLK